MKPKISKKDILRVGVGQGKLYSANYHVGDRLSLPRSEPNAYIRSRAGFKGKIVFDTPTTVAPIARMAFAGGGADSVPTVMPMTASQSRLATMMTRKKMLRRAGKHYAGPNQTPSLYDRNAPSTAKGGPIQEGSSKRRKTTSSGNIHNSVTKSTVGSVLEPPNQEDTDITSTYPNPIEPLPPNNPIEQQGNQYANFRGALRLPMASKNFPILVGSRGLDRNLDGKGPEIGPFNTEAQSDERLEAIHAITWN
jgi:hypothetical protein